MRAETAIYNREKDAKSLTAEWFSDLLKPDPWFKDTVPNVLQIECIFTKTTALT